MNLPNDIHLKIEKSPDKEDILLLLTRLENDGVTITNDVYAAIVATLEYTKLGAIDQSSPHFTPLLMLVECDLCSSTSWKSFRRGGLGPPAQQITVPRPADARRPDIAGEEAAKERADLARRPHAALCDHLLHRRNHRHAPANQNLTHQFAHLGRRNYFSRRPVC